MSNPPRQLDVIQRWMQAVITHPLGPGRGADSDGAMQEIPAGKEKLDTVILPSSKLDSLRRIEVYANAYYGRLIECMAGEFTVLVETIGEEAFNELAFAYLQRYPSASYTLNDLSRNFAKYLDESRPDRAGLAEGEQPAVSWPDLMIDLAKLEWTIGEVFDAPGVEGEPILTAADLQNIPPANWADVKLEPVVCLRLLAFTHPVNDYFTRVRHAEEGETVPMPDPGEEYAAIFRRDYVVRRHVLSRPQFVLISALRDGATLGDAIARAAEETDMSDDDLASHLRAWFEEWTAAGMFHRVQLGGSCDR